jgi:5'-nucleotidase
MKILVTNDDGINAPGIKILAQSLEPFADVAIVAPDRERSAIGHALTLHHPLRAIRQGKNIFAIDGTPTDCVNLGIHTLLPFKPDLVISGINHGSNLGDDVTYSGTVSAAMEATLMGIPAFAVSLVTNGGGTNFSAAGCFAAKLAAIIMKNGLPTDTFLNINVPDLPADQLLRPIITRQGKRQYEGMIINKVDPRGRDYYWIGTSDVIFHDIEGTDYYAVSRGHISITPLHLDLTNYQSICTLQQWELE